MANFAHVFRKCHNPHPMPGSQRTTAFTTSRGRTVINRSYKRFFQSNLWYHLHACPISKVIDSFAMFDLNGKPTFVIIRMNYKKGGKFNRPRTARRFLLAAIQSACQTLRTQFHRAEQNSIWIIKAKIINQETYQRSYQPNKILAVGLNLTEKNLTWLDQKLEHNSIELSNIIEKSRTYNSIKRCNIFNNVAD